MHTVVVYGSLKKGFHNHRLLEGSKLLNDKVFFSGTMASLGGFPCVSKQGNTKIVGEMYEVDDLTFGNLDALEGHPAFYERERIHTSEGEAWVYFIEDQSYYADPSRIVKSGDWQPDWQNQEVA